MKPLPVTTEQTDCWNRIGVWGDRSCPELATVIHCHNCPVFSAAGRRFLASPPPDGYLEAWAARLAEKEDEGSAELQGVLIFRIGEEWLALPVAALREVLPLRPIHRIPFRGGLLAGVVNVRGEVYLCMRMDHLLGLSHRAEAQKDQPRLLVIGRGDETWLFRVDEVERVHRLALKELQPVPPTLGRAATRFTRGVFSFPDHAVGLLDEGRLFEVLRTSLR